MKTLFVTMVTCLAILFGGMANADAATLNVVHHSALSWSANYKIETSGDKIKKVSNVKASSRIGKITRQYVTQDSSNKVTLHITRVVGPATYHVRLSARVSKGKLYVTFS
ncbi:DUF5626 family protein [Levilactobacillus koreensis]|uniref:DUF5626 domain-containing protein n=1 Tax=Levilactobacillus koreensis TaxID=637971 RepID=A0AAC8ZH00_9LACO|nr:DUF5626 family protein [Levilactobacillus koreensis]AKP64694.1 hypothetical protein ABN16_06585 [Levilactobacillus koreensis]